MYEQAFASVMHHVLAAKETEYCLSFDLPFYFCILFLLAILVSSIYVSRVIQLLCGLGLLSISMLEANQILSHLNCQRVCVYSVHSQSVQPVPYLHLQNERFECGMASSSSIFITRNISIHGH